ncbi:hypothetical protein PR048_004006 [Dryococelus australis]|uniref:Uncharacterized protein n=1 Tax=Dryococelus australis TaxID=614101 RepID=A0ABQ9I485_9NEOP|nr:hypothetical protein PR048_004006 [Dryococelus australis]
MAAYDRMSIGERSGGEGVSRLLGGVMGSRSRSSVSNMSATIADSTKIDWVWPRGVKRVTNVCPLSPTHYSALLDNTRYKAGRKKPWQGGGAGRGCGGLVSTPSREEGRQASRVLPTLQVAAATSLSTADMRAVPTLLLALAIHESLKTVWLSFQRYVAQRARRLNCSPPTKANWVRFPAISKWVSQHPCPCGVAPRIFARGSRCRWWAGFLGDLPFPSPLRSGAAPYSPRFTLVHSQDADVSKPLALHSYVQSRQNRQSSLLQPKHHQHNHLRGMKSFLEMWKERCIPAGIGNTAITRATSVAEETGEDVICDCADVGQAVKLYPASSPSCATFPWLHHRLWHEGSPIATWWKCGSPRIRRTAAVWDYMLRRTTNLKAVHDKPVGTHVSYIPYSLRWSSLKLPRGPPRGAERLASHQVKPGSIPGRFSPYCRKRVSCRRMPLVGGFSRGSPVSLHTHLTSPSSALKTSVLRAAQIFRSLTYIRIEQRLQQKQSGNPAEAQWVSRATTPNACHRACSRPVTVGTTGTTRQWSVRVSEGGNSCDTSRKQEHLENNRRHKPTSPPPGHPIPLEQGDAATRRYQAGMLAGLAATSPGDELVPRVWSVTPGQYATGWRLPAGCSGPKQCAGEARPEARHPGQQLSSSGVVLLPPPLTQVTCGKFDGRRVFSERSLVPRPHIPPVPHLHFRKWESCWVMPLVGGFSRGSPVSPSLAFRRYSILTSFHPLKTSLLRVAQISQLQIWATPNYDVLRADDGEGRGVRYGAAPGCKIGGGGESSLENPSPSDIVWHDSPTCESPGATPPGIETGSPRWEASSLTTTPPRPPELGFDTNTDALHTSTVQRRWAGAVCGVATCQPAVVVLAHSTAATPSFSPFHSTAPRPT